VVDIEKNTNLRRRWASLNLDGTFFDGDIFKGWPDRTIVEGKTVIKDGEIVGKLGQGRFISRNYAG
jgi:dihydropyrimidinase